MPRATTASRPFPCGIQLSGSQSSIKYGADEDGATTAEPTVERFGEPTTDDGVTQLEEKRALNMDESSWRSRRIHKAQS